MPITPRFACLALLLLSSCDLVRLNPIDLETQPGDSGGTAGISGAGQGGASQAGTSGTPNGGASGASGSGSAGSAGSCDGTCLHVAVQAVAAGANHSCALSTAGAVRCWGFGNVGLLGYGNTNDIGDDETPASAGNVDVGGLVKQLALGSFSTCALLTTNNVRCWGFEFEGQLGYGRATGNIGDDETPDSVGDIDLGGTVTQIGVGNTFACALLDTGRMRCWGDRNVVQIGYARNTGNIGDDETPASVGDIDVGGTVTQIAVGGQHVCALLTSSNVRCWGFNTYGELGYAVGDRIPFPPAAFGDVNVGGPVTQIVAGDSHTCALLSTGNVRCWGNPHDGQLGYGNTELVGDDETPAAVGDINVGGRVQQIAAGGYHTCALLDTGAVRCWGAGDHGELGYRNTNSIGDDETPASAGDVNVGGSVTQIAAGKFHTCAVLTTGAARCWGNNGYGELGYGNTNDVGDDETPASVGDVSVF